MITLIIIGITCVISYLAFQDSALFSKLSFNAYDIVHRKQYYRLITNAFVHANWEHLLMNMLVLYFFGQTQEFVYQGFEKAYLFPLLYILAIPASSLISLSSHKDDPFYTAVGASGAVNAVVFSYILINPLSNIYIFFAIPIKAIIFAVLYLAYSWYMAKRNRDHIGHEAHISGAIFGLIYTIATVPDVLKHFVYQFVN